MCIQGHAGQCRERMCSPTLIPPPVCTLWDCFNQLLATLKTEGLGLRVNDGAQWEGVTGVAPGELWVGCRDSKYL